MYVPKNFAMQAKEITAVLGDAGLAHLVTHDDAGYLVTPVPLLYRPTSNTLVGHVSRANPHWHRTGPSIAIFAGPQGYISPSLYATKAETGKVVPTWNYEVLNVHGTSPHTTTPNGYAHWSQNSPIGMSTTGIRHGGSTMLPRNSRLHRFAPLFGSN